jgi:hypothetical protein
MSEFRQIQTVTDDAAHPLKVFDDARREIANANTVQQVNRILALATGLAAAARNATDREMEAEAQILKLEAERRLGQLMQAQKEEVGFNIGTRGSRVKGARVNEKPTLAEAGIDKNTAHRARRAAAMPEAKFNEVAEAKREAVLTRSNKTRLKKPKTGSAPKKSVTPGDTALFNFTAQVCNLLQRIARQAPDRFAKTAVEADDLAKLGKFFAALARLKAGAAR